jgi:hypothetical protein
LLTFEQLWAMVVAGDGGLSPSSLRNGDRLLWWLSNDGGAPTGVVDLGEASGMVGSLREAAHQRDSEVGWWLGLGSVLEKFCTKPHLFIGVLIPTHRGFGILSNLSRNQLQITTGMEKSEWERKEFLFFLIDVSTNAEVGIKSKNI